MTDGGLQTSMSCGDLAARPPLRVDPCALLHIRNP